MRGFALNGRNLEVRNSHIADFKRPNLDTQAIPKLHAGFDGNAVADDHVVLDEDVGADVAVGADAGAGEDHHKLPDTRERANVCRLHIGQSMDLRCHAVSEVQ